MTGLDWWPESARTRREEILSTPISAARVEHLAAISSQIHDEHCINLNPATNTMNPRAEALLSSGLGSRASLGYPGEKYEMGLEAIEEIEVIAAELAGEVFGAAHAEVRVPSGAMANLYAFMATCEPGDSVIVPPATVGGHVTHNTSGCAGLYGLRIHEAPIDPDRYTVDVDGVATLAAEVQPRLITIGTSLNLLPHPVAALRAVADDCGAALLFDAAHACGMFAGSRWPNPLDEGAHLMTMSTYKSLGGPPSGLIVTNDDMLARRIDGIAFPGMTANFDAAKTAALALTLCDWRAHGTAYAEAMTTVAASLAECLGASGVPVFHTVDGPTISHQFAVDARTFGGGHAAAQRLREANLLTSAIGLPTGLDDGLRFGTNEITRWGMSHTDMPELATYVAQALHGEPADVADRVSAMRRRFTELHFID
ncbi:MAG: serine hydroxymethyltransferase [Acidimicrobiales bacterium]|nr:serine hydroxymethyltransferase [Acidimicrobiales bacterium]